MGIQSVDWDAKERIYVKRIIKQIIIACGCYNTDTDEYVNECGTENCPLLKERDIKDQNGHKMKNFKTGFIEDEDQE
jgi:hypothetical protein